MKLRSWYAVYAKTDDCPEPSSLLAALQPHVPDLALEGFSEQSPWTFGVIKFPPEQVSWTDESLASFIRVRRGLTGDLEVMHSWAVQLVSDNPTWGKPVDVQQIREHLERTKQIFYLHTFAVARAASMARICEQICGYLCRTVDGLIQVHQEGFFSPAGESIFPRCDSHRLKTT